MKKLSLTMDRDDIYPYPWMFADEILTDIANKDLFGYTITRTLKEIIEGHLYSYDDMDEYKKIGEYLLKKVIENRGFYKEVEENIYNLSEDLLVFLKKIEKQDLKDVSNNEIYDLYKEYVQRLKELRRWGWIPVLIDGTEPFLSTYLLKKFKDSFPKLSEEERGRYYSTLTSSEKISDVRREEYDRLCILSEMRKMSSDVFNRLEREGVLDDKKWREKVERHTKNYEWLSYAYEGPALDYKRVLKLMKESIEELGENIEEERDKIENYEKTITKEIRDAENILHLPEDLSYLFKVSRFFMFLKEYRKGVYQKSYVVMDQVIYEIANRSTIDFKGIKFLTSDEVEKVLINNIDLKNEAEQRKSHCLLLVEGGRSLICSDKKKIFALKEKFCEEPEDSKEKELKGMIAFAGRVKGVVKIVLSTNDIDKVEEGDILISSSTNPDLVSAMKKAAAFVTDFGGITSHAAIVSREMKKPCVVGTKNATKILKDGDIIEVDAYKGIIKINP